MSFLARFEGICGACEERIHEGDQLMYHEESYVHVTCPEPPDPLTPPPNQSRCPRCFTYHRGEC